MITEQLRQIFGVTVCDGPLEIRRVELLFFSFICLGLSSWGLCIFLLSLTGHFNLLLLYNWLRKLFPLLIFKCGWFNAVL